DRPGDLVGGQALGVQGDSRPGEEEADDLPAQVPAEANLLADHQELTLSVLRHRAGEVVVRGDPDDLDPARGAQVAKLLTCPLTPIDRIAVRPLPIDLDAVVPVRRRALDDLAHAQRAPAIPNSEIGYRIKPHLHRIPPSSLIGLAGRTTSAISRSRGVSRVCSGLRLDSWTTPIAGYDAIWPSGSWILDPGF